jgi:hypothetical protein
LKFKPSHHTVVHSDPIHSFFQPGYVHSDPWFIFNQTQQLDKEIKSIDPDKNLSEMWTDGIPLDDFFGDDYSKKLIITNNIVQCSAEQAKHIHTVNPSYYGQYFFDYPNTTVEIQKDFNFFVNRYDVSRQSWLYQLIRRNLFDRGFISFGSEVRPNALPGEEFAGLDPSQAFELGFQLHNKIFATEHEIIKHQIPYKNFEDTGDLTNIVLASKFSIVLETFFHDNRIITFSEKICRCLQLPRPWILYSSQYGIDYLRQLGFDVLDDQVDHSYDHIADAIQRQVAILDQCQLLVKQPLDLARCQQAANHNKSLLKSFKDNWLVNIQQDFDLAYQKLLAL